MKRESKVLEIEEKDEFFTVYSDMITFVAVLFILLFTLIYNKIQDQTFFEQMRVEFGGKKIEQKKTVTSEDLFVSKVQGYIKEEQLSQYALVLIDEQKIHLILNDQMLFEPGSAILLEGAEQVLYGFSSIIKKVKNPIVIEGHTDDRPIYNEEYESNWELSVRRAYAVLRFLLDHTQVSPKQLSIKGFGPYRPIVPNTSAKNRALNRRVEINIVRVKEAQQ